MHQLFKVSSGADRPSFLLKKKKLEKIFYQHMFSVMFRSLFHSVIPKIRPSYCKSNSAAQKLQHPMAILVFTSNFSSHTKRWSSFYWDHINWSVKTSHRAAWPWIWSACPIRWGVSFCLRSNDPKLCKHYCQLGMNLWMKICINNTPENHKVMLIKHISFNVHKICKSSLISILFTMIW